MFLNLCACMKEHFKLVAIKGNYRSDDQRIGQKANSSSKCNIFARNEQNLLWSIINEKISNIFFG